MLATGIEVMVRCMKNGELRAVEVIQKCLEIIALLDKQGPCLNAVTRVNEAAIEQANRLDAIAAAGRIAGPLHGIPILLKDNVDEAGIPNTAGSVCLTGNIPVSDAAIIERLRKAGAIIVARANLHEFAIWGETASSLQGQTLNPYDLTRTPGGSSGGTGAGVAAGYAVAGIGTDTVNSVRSPASANALVGLRPTMGLVSRRGIIPYSLTQDTAGPITCSVADAAILLDVLAGEDSADAVTRGSRGKIPLTYTAALSPESLRGKRIGILRSFFGVDPVHDAVNAIMETALEAMRKSGAQMFEVLDFLDADRITSQVSVHLFDLEPDLNSYLCQMSPELPVHSLREILASGRFHPGIGENIRQAAELKRESVEYTRRLAAQAKLRDTLLEIMKSAQLDALVFPHQRRLVAKVGEKQLERNGVLAAVTGFPSLVFPGGFTPPDATAPQGVPVGVELLGRPWSEETLLSMAFAFEQVCPVYRPPIFRNL